MATVDVFLHRFRDRTDVVAGLRSYLEDPNDKRSIEQVAAAYQLTPGEVAALSLLKAQLLGKRPAKKRKPLEEEDQEESSSFSFFEEEKREPPLQLALKPTEEQEQKYQQLRALLANQVLEWTAREAVLKPKTGLLDLLFYSPFVGLVKYLAALKPFITKASPAVVSTLEEMEHLQQKVAKSNLTQEQLESPVLQGLGQVDERVALFAVYVLLARERVDFDVGTATFNVAAGDPVTLGILDLFNEHVDRWLRQDVFAFWPEWEARWRPLVFGPQQAEEERVESPRGMELSEEEEKETEVSEEENWWERFTLAQLAKTFPLSKQQRKYRDRFHQMVGEFAQRLAQVTDEIEKLVLKRDYTRSMPQIKNEDGAKSAIISLMEELTTLFRQLDRTKFLPPEWVRVVREIRVLYGLGKFAKQYGNQLDNVSLAGYKDFLAGVDAIRVLLSLLSHPKHGSKLPRLADYADQLRRIDAAKPEKSLSRQERPKRQKPA